MKCGWTWGLALLCASCIYSYDNPIARAPNGTIIGTLTFADGGAAGGQVNLLWTDLAVGVGADGRFTFIGLPDGTYSLKYVLDAGAGNPPFIAYLPTVQLASQAADQTGLDSDSISLGSIAVTPAARVTGQVTGLDAGEAVVGAFVTDDGGATYYESFATSTDGGGFTLDLPPGPHQLWASDSSRAGMTAVVALAQSNASVTIALPPSDGGPSASQGALLGDLVIGLPGFGGTFADAGAVADLLGTGTNNNVEINPPPDAGSSSDGGSDGGAINYTPYIVEISGQIASKGAEMNYAVAAGTLGDFYCGLKSETYPGADGGLALNDILLRQIPGIAGQVTNLGQITWLPVETFQRNDAGVPQNYPVRSEDGG